MKNEGKHETTRRPDNRLIITSYKRRWITGIHKALCIDNTTANKRLVVYRIPDKWLFDDKDKIYTQQTC